MNDMGKEDLLRGLEAFYDWYCEQVSPLVDEPKVYAQLKAIVEQHFDLSYHPSAFGNNKQSPAPGVDEHPDGEIAGLAERYADLLLTKAQDEPLDFRRVFKKCVNELLKLYDERIIQQALPRRVRFSGYQPDGTGKLLDPKNPPKGGSGVPPKQKRTVKRGEIMKVVKRINDEITPGGMTTARMVEIAYEELGLEVIK